jgi:hypothetical protein
VIVMKILNNRSTVFGLSLAALVACAPGQSSDVEISSTQQAITDVPHTPVERQSIGNCWLYAEATWVESMAKARDDGNELDISQSYWTYWHWYDQLTGFFPGDEVRTGGNQWTSHQIIRDRGVMLELNFVPEDDDGEMSDRQAAALDQVNAFLAGNSGSIDGREARELLDDAWGLSPEVRAQLDQAFGDDGARTLRQGANLSGTNIVDPGTVQVRYTERVGTSAQVRDASLLDAIQDWDTVSYPHNQSARRDFLRRVQLALHDRQPVVITWDVDFNALENNLNGREGSFNLQTLEDAGGPGRQGGHMTVLEDYAAVTDDFGLLEAGVTLDPADPDDADRLEAALRDSTQITLLRTKNSWGAARPDREFAPGFPGYHDLWMDYLNGPIAYCPGEDDPTNDNCTGETVPLANVMLPPGY